MKKILSITIILSILISVHSCKDPDPEPTENEILHEWIWDAMNEVYLWADDIDQTLYPTDSEDPESFFYSLLHPDDRFSWIVDDYEELMNMFNNVELSTGISPYFIGLSNSDDVIVVVEYVSKASPAEEAGIERGDIIIEVNGTQLDVDNYSTLFYDENPTFGFADYADGLITPNEISISVTPEIIEQNPVQYSEIIEYDGKKIAYIVYTGFSSGESDIWVDSLDNVFADFQSENVDDIIVDIRYNPGGRVSVARHLASLIAPTTVSGNSDNVFVKYEWNDLLNDYFIETDGADSENLLITFDETPVNSLNMSDVYFLTSRHSASASELIIIALDPYMNVTQIGENTYGKFYGSITVPDIEEPVRHNWAMQPIVFKYTNSVGYTDFVNGLTPDVSVDDNLLIAKPFGDTSDPILAQALEEITGVSPLAKKASASPVNYILLPDPVREYKTRTSWDNKPDFKR